MEVLQQQPTEKELGLTPREIVEELDRFIIGQAEAKKMVAIALRNRARRRQVPESLRDEIIPKNIIMIGPTGVGKTEIARRLARLVQAPFIKVEATKFTEVGYVGRDVDSMIRDLMENAVNTVRDEWTERVRPLAESRTEERLLDLLLPPPRDMIRNVRKKENGREEVTFDSDITYHEDDEEQERRKQSHERYVRNRDKFRKMLQTGQIDDRQVEVSVQQPSAMVSAIPMGPNMPGMEEMGMNLQEMLQNMMPSKSKQMKMPIREARRVLLEEEIEKLLEMEKIVHEAQERVEETGIIFIDEVDKIAGRTGGSGPDVSREGVQRDILPIIEGSTVFTKYGMIRTDHILFIGSGAFHTAKVSDLIPELQGRFPLRVELHSLQVEDFQRILTEPENSLTKQYSALLETEGVNIVFDSSAIEALAEIAFQVNEQTENIGARRLHTLMEKLLEDLSFDAPKHRGEAVRIDADYVNSQLKDIASDQDLSRFIL